MKGQGTAPAIVEIKMKDGSVYSKKSGYLFGSPEKPISLINVADKFRHCCEYSVKPIPREKQDRVIEMIEGLEKVKDTGSIIRLLG